ncbi:MAG TPA: PepSY-associated TM helix domain-containing protein [Sphingomicrobium sp.]|nr:PepSY-associated TM helix domain-containing protein [Sphingomicrobium sp.]
MSKARTRQFWTKIHRWLGLTALVFLFIAGVTGSFLCFDKRIDAALNPDLFYRHSEAPALASPQIADRFAAARPDLVITQFPLNPRPTENLKVEVASRSSGTPPNFNEVFLDPTNGQIVGTRLVTPGWDRRHLVQGVYELHQNLLGGTLGRWVMGLAALAWLISNFVGLYLTFPAKKPFWQKWKKKWGIDMKAKLRRFMLELHNASGLWLLIFASVLAYTSVAMNFFDEAFVPAMQTISPAKASMFDTAPKAPAKAARISFAEALPLGIAAARADGLNWKPALERYSAEFGAYGVTFTDNGVENYHLLGPITYYIDGDTGRFVESDDPYHDSFGRKLTRSLYPLHSGDVAGPYGIAVIFLLGLATAEMCVTGFYTWWKKRESRKPAKSRSSRARA